MNCLIVEDENLGAELLESNIREVPFLKVVGIAKNAVAAAKLLASQKIDLVFLDVRMPGMSGIHFLRSIPNPPLAIIVTASPEFALAGYELDVVDYLMKPVPKARFLSAVQKAMCRYEAARKQKEVTENDFIFVNANYSLVRVDMQEIAYLQALKDYSRIHLTSGSFVTTRISLKTVEEKLNSVRFMRVHKSFIVALDKIDQVQKTLTVAGREIPIGTGYKEMILKRISEKSL